VPGGDHVARCRGVAVGSLSEAAVLLAVTAVAIARVVRAFVNGALGLGDGDGQIRATRNRSDPKGAAAERKGGGPMADYQRGRQASVAGRAGGLSEESERLISNAPGTGPPVTSHRSGTRFPEAESDDRAEPGPGGSTRY
jgi:hypothetical protein